MLSIRKLLVVSALCCVSTFCRAQQKLLSYEDLAYIITNNLQKTDNFLLTKGYTKVAVKKANNLRFSLAMPESGTTSNVEIRWDGRKVNVYITTDEIQQLNLINNSIAPYILSREEISGILTYRVKELGTIYMTVNEKVPYSPIKKDYDISLVSDKTITTYN